MINEKDLFRLTLYGARYALPVTRAEHEGFENEQVERALQEGNAIVGIVFGRHPTQAWHYLGSDVNRKWKLRKWKLIEKYAKNKGLLRARSSVLTTTD